MDYLASLAARGIISPSAVDNFIQKVGDIRKPLSLSGAGGAIGGPVPKKVPPLMAGGLDPVGSPNLVSKETVGGRIVSAPLDEGFYINSKDYNKTLHEPYFKGDEKIASSREVPFTGNLPSVGTWRIDNHKGLYGRNIDQLQRLKLDELELPEVREGKLDPVKRGDDERYAQWLKAGKRPPPIEVLETEGGGLKVIDGHRRALAAKAVGADDIEAWVSHTVPSGKIDSNGKPMMTGLTYEMLNK